MDNQVKIDGYRVELGEIEAALRNIPTIRAAVVVEKKVGNKNVLAAVFIADSDNVNENSGYDNIKSNLSKVLPQYMIPSIFQEIERFPLGSNGKIDRKKILINLAECELKKETSVCRAENELQEKLLHIWTDILEQEVNLDSDFFDMRMKEVRM